MQRLYNFIIKHSIFTFIKEGRKDCLAVYMFLFINITFKLHIPYIFCSHTKTHQIFLAVARGGENTVFFFSLLVVLQSLQVFLSLILISPCLLDAYLPQRGAIYTTANFWSRGGVEVICLPLKHCRNISPSPLLQRIWGAQLVWLLHLEILLFRRKYIWTVAKIRIQLISES